MANLEDFEKYFESSATGKVGYFHEEEKEREKVLKDKAIAVVEKEMADAHKKKDEAWATIFSLERILIELKKEEDGE